MSTGKKKVTCLQHFLRKVFFSPKNHVIKDLARIEVIFKGGCLAGCCKNLARSFKEMQPCNITSLDQLGL